MQLQHEFVSDMLQQRVDHPAAAHPSAGVTSRCRPCTDILIVLLTCAEEDACAVTTHLPATRRVDLPTKLCRITFCWPAPRPNGTVIAARGRSVGCCIESIPRFMVMLRWTFFLVLAAHCRKQRSQQVQILTRVRALLILDAHERFDRGRRPSSRIANGD